MITFAGIIELVSKHAGVTSEEIYSSSRERAPHRARCVVVLLTVRYKPRLPFAQMGRILGKDHTSILNCRDVGIKWLKEDPAFRQFCIQMARRLRDLPLSEPKDMPLVHCHRDTVQKHAKHIIKNFPDWAPPKIRAVLMNFHGDAPSMLWLNKVYSESRSQRHTEARRRNAAYARSFRYPKLQFAQPQPEPEAKDDRERSQIEHEKHMRNGSAALRDALMEFFSQRTVSSPGYILG